MRMSKFTCPKCGHESDGLSPINQELPGWESIVGPELAAKMSTKFTAVQGDYHPPMDGALSRPFRTLFLSAVERVSILDLVQEKPSVSDSDFFRDHHLPALQMLDKRFEIVGCLAPPTVISLAMSDLIAPRGVFAFVTVVDEPGLADRLRAVGLERLLCEGAVDTLGGIDWFDAVAPAGPREPHVFPAEVHATPPPPASCEDCGAGDQPLISKGDHHGGTKIVCADRAACHARGG